MFLTDGEASVGTVVDPEKEQARIQENQALGKPLNDGDVPIIARSTLGADANRVSRAQMRAYVDAFRGYISRKYGKRFNEFVGGRIEVKDVREVKSWHEVRSMVYLRGQSPFEVSFLVSDRSGQDLFFDMVIEGISLRISERTEIGAMLDRRNGDIGALISDLRSAG